jgi:hypothetical protein
LIDGTQVESDKHQEVLEAETIIQGAIDALKTHIAALGEFDGGDNLNEA